MPNWVWGVAFVVAYVVLTQWLLPKLGIPTWRSQGCAESRRKTPSDPNHWARSRIGLPSTSAPHEEEIAARSSRNIDRTRGACDLCPPCKSAPLL